ncbi:MAG: hypothetical protein PHV02_03290 [Rhodocyclaceae bacterium]|nr:hypothetical protein [Rhodocyclaceae bacterium]
MWKKKKHKATLLLDAICQIPGRKIITISDSEDDFDFDVHADGSVGYKPSHRHMLLAALRNGLENDCGLIIRQFIPDSEEPVVMPNGNTVMMPWKALYGIRLGGGNIEALSAEVVEQCCTTDSCTGDTFDSEPFVVYKDFADYLPASDALVAS